MLIQILRLLERFPAGRGNEPWLVHRARDYVLSKLSDWVSMLPKCQYCLFGLGIIQRRSLITWSVRWWLFILWYCMSHYITCARHVYVGLIWWNIHSLFIVSFVLNYNPRWRRLEMYAIDLKISWMLRRFIMKYFSQDYERVWSKYTACIQTPVRVLATQEPHYG